MTLGALYTNPQKGMSKTDRPCILLLKLAPHPKIRHRFGFCERVIFLISTGFAHPLAISEIIFIRSTAGGDHDSLNHFVIRNVLFNLVMNPLVPLQTGLILTDSHVPQLLRVVTGQVTEKKWSTMRYTPWNSAIGQSCGYVFEHHCPQQIGGFLADLAASPKYQG